MSAHIAVTAAGVVFLLVGFGAIGWWAWRDEKADVREFDRHVKEALAVADETPDAIAVEVRAVWHPSMGDRLIAGRRVICEEHPARTAERILEANQLACCLCPKCEGRRA